jgi:protein-S-isoprenylcysteine O-methyltransferase Ste14
MGQDSSEVIFKVIWGGLLIIAVTAQVLFKGKVTRRGNLMTTALVVAPYLIVFGWFSARERIGTFDGGLVTQTLGLVLMLAGAAGYIVSIAHLRHNWAVSAAIKEGHTLVERGPYRFVRHPMYFCMTVVVLGSGLLISNVMILLYTPLVLFIYALRAQKEEELLKDALPGYADYCRRVKMLVPGIL